MKILIVEDDELNVRAAAEQLKDHELTFVKNFVDFYNDFYKKIVRDQNLNRDSRDKQITLSLSEYDMVLTDVNLPSPIDMEPQIINGSTGLLVVLKALESGVRYIGVITDANHHSADPIAKGFDMFMRAPDYNGRPIKTMRFGESRLFLECYNACKDMPYLGERRAKNWRRLFEILLTSIPES